MLDMGYERKKQLHRSTCLAVDDISIELKRTAFSCSDFFLKIFKCIFLNIYLYMHVRIYICILKYFLKYVYIQYMHMYVYVCMCSTHTFGFCFRSEL